MTPATSRPPPQPIVVLMGVSGCGKTAVGRALAAGLGVAFVDADDLHPPANVRKMSAGEPLSDADRGPWLDAVAQQMARAAAEGRGLVVACSALKRAYRDRLRRATPALRLVWLTGPTSLIRDRLAARTSHFMPVALLESQLATLEPPTTDERPLVADVSPPPEDLAAWIDARLGGREPGT
jgi:carbohydrate kinase (thermoresistant glucokinase family)